MKAKRKGKSPTSLVISSSQGLDKKASKRLGGITVWSSTEKSLEDALGKCSNAIDQCAKAHLTTAKPVLRKLVRGELAGMEIEDRVFSAVLGNSLRRGDLDAMICVSKNDRPFRVLVHKSQAKRFADAVKAAEGMIRKSGKVEVRELEEKIFGRRAYNTWSSSSHVLGYLSNLGIGQIDDMGACRLVDGLP